MTKTVYYDGMKDPKSTSLIFESMATLPENAEPKIRADEDIPEEEFTEIAYSSLPVVSPR